MRIAILTFHRAANCGAVLQAWALQTVFRQMGHEVVFPKVNQVGNEEGRIYYLRRVPYWRKGVARLAVIVKRALLDVRRFGREPASAALYRAFRERFQSGSAARSIGAVGGNPSPFPRLVGDGGRQGGKGD